MDKGGLFLGVNAVSHNPILCDKGNLMNQSAIITGVPGSGKSVMAKTFVNFYILNSNDADVDKRGNSYKKVDNGAQTVPFRPYFVAATTTNPARQMTRSIVFSDEQTQLEGKDDRDLRGEDTYSLSIYAKRKKIVVESNLRETTEVRIVNPAGITINTFDIEPGETVETRIYNSGVYIVYADNGRYIMKLGVK
jgi:hypothetical protein